MNPFVLVIAHATDSGAAAVAALMTERLGTASVRIVRPEMLSLVKWSHRVNAAGRAATRLQLTQAPPIDDAHVSSVLNRIHYLSVPRFRNASLKDREYAGAELQALVASWLAGLGRRVLHPVREYPWVTPMLARQHWVDAAIACGISVHAQVAASSERALRLGPTGGREQRATARDDVWSEPVGTVLVAGDRVYGSLSATYGRRCLGVSRRLRLPLLEFRFASYDDDAVLADVTPFPSLTEPWAATAAADLLESVARSGAS